MSMKGQDVHRLAVVLGVGLGLVQLRAWSFGCRGPPLSGIRRLYLMGMCSGA